MESHVDLVLFTLTLARSVSVCPPQLYGIIGSDSLLQTIEQCEQNRHMPIGRVTLSPRQQTKHQHSLRRRRIVRQIGSEKYP